ncbi:hypothetical protein [Aquisphaera insulae]|uniref:hypothetical protein n=1 Tax=Aquisphaera insulae TaxID=2712864 RepID=UPI0013EABFC1|nr:hypothetical protein [Aquisphaera insulae]
MDSTDAEVLDPPRKRWASILPAFAFAAICLWPHAERMIHPSLFSDDVIRIAQLRTSRFGDVILRPFNEHFAPVFQLVTWSTWQLCGQRPTVARWGFTAASLLPFVIALGVLFLLVRREARSLAAALAATAAFSLSAVHAEAAWWYSASSFTWALVGTIVAWLAAATAIDRERAGLPSRASWWLAVAAAVSAPAFSAIGLLAGPTAAIRVGLDTRIAGRRKSHSILPVAGTLAYLAGASLLRYHAVVTESVHQNADVVGGLLAALRAPGDVLLPGLFGLGNIDGLMRGGLDLAVSAGLLASLVVVMARSEGSIRAAITAGLALIVGGYALTYCVRNQYGAHWLLEVQRYHLFPQLGLVVILGLMARRPLSRMEERPVAALAFGTVFAGLLLALHLPRMREIERNLSFPDQPRSLAALEDMEQLSRHRRIGRDDLLAALPPVRPRWYPHEGSILEMLPRTRRSGMPPDQVVRILRDSLATRDLESLLGGMDASALLLSSDGPTGKQAIARGDLVDSVGARPDGPGRWRGSANRMLLEFDLGRSIDGRPLFLHMPGLERAEKAELWWAGDRDAWTEARSASWKGTSPGATVLPLDRLPHWSAEHSRRVRLVVRSDRPIAVEAPRLLR